MANLDEKLRAYFLGELTEDEAVSLENEVFGDEAKFAALQAAENDLLDDYTHKRLPPNSKKSFEKHYLNSPFRHQRLEFAQTMAEHLQNDRKDNQVVEKSQFAWMEFFSFWKIGAAFAGLVLLFLGGFWLIKTSNQPPKDEVILTKTSEPTPTISPNITPKISPTPTVEKTPDKIETNKTVSPSPTPKPTVSPTPTVEKTPIEPKPNQTVVLALSTIGLRDGGNLPQLKVVKETKNAVLRLNLGETNAKIFDVKIQNVEGQTIQQIKKVRSNGKNISINLSANLLKNDDYIVEVSMINASGEPEEVANFSFRVLRR